MQDDTSTTNLRVLTETTREFGVYPAPPRPPDALPPCEVPASAAERPALRGLAGPPPPAPQPGVCFPWDRKAAELPPVTGDAAMVRRVWEETDGLAYKFIWHVLLSF
jgi:hypothetical protein